MRTREQGPACPLQQWSRGRWHCHCLTGNEHQYATGWKYTGEDRYEPTPCVADGRMDHYLHNGSGYTQKRVTVVSCKRCGQPIQFRSNRAQLCRDCEKLVKKAYYEAHKHKCKWRGCPTMVTNHSASGYCRKHSTETVEYRAKMSRQTRRGLSKIRESQPVAQMGMAAE